MDSVKIDLGLWKCLNSVNHIQWLICILASYSCDLALVSQKLSVLSNPCISVIQQSDVSDFLAAMLKCNVFCLKQVCLNLFLQNYLPPEFPCQPCSNSPIGTYQGCIWNCLLLSRETCPNSQYAKKSTLMNYYIWYIWKCAYNGHFAIP